MPSASMKGLPKTILPFFFFLFLQSLDFVVGQSGQQGPLALGSERDALFALRSSLGLRSRDWPRKVDPCSAWIGVRCSGGRVVALDVSGLRRTRLGRLNPQFAVDGLANLTLLSSFNASSFELPGAIPDWFGQRLAALQTLDLRSCSVVGPIPASLGSLQNLTFVYLSDNFINGSLPETLGQLPRLAVLDLSRNSLNGLIPSSLSGLRRLAVLDLSLNFLSGAIPPALGTLSNLSRLILANNSLFGSIPAQLGDLSLLVELDVSFNSLSGPLPSDLRGLRNLQKLDVENNVLSGPLQMEMFSNLNQLLSVVLGHNNFSGVLPNAVWVLPRLLSLDVSFNNFTGILPSPVPVSSNITAGSFNLSHNLFYGSLPSQFGNSSTVDLSGNYFEGRISVSYRLNASFDDNCLREVLNQRSLEECVSFYTSRGLKFDGFGAPSPEATQPSPPSGKSSRNLKYILAGVFSGLAFIVLLVVLVVLFVRRRERGTGGDQREIGTNQVSSGRSGPPPSGINIDFSSLGESFTYEQLTKVTGGFGEWNLIKNGHSGDLYRGVLENGTQIVVKRVDVQRFKKDTYKVELDFFSKASHTRLVPLLGHCLEHENEKFLVYKHMPNGDLSNALYRKNNSEEDGLQSLDWITRLKIATGVAEALSYLHHECTPPFVHRDVQASSILLDDKFEVRLGSLSEVSTQEGDAHQNMISRLLRLPQTSEQGVSGSSATCAYDVYCLGKVLLELVTGKLGISGSNDPSTNEWLDEVLPYINAYEKDLVTKILDPSLIVDEDLLEEVWAMAIVAKTCLNTKPAKRPLARYILKALENPLKVVREENTGGSARLRTTSSRGSWNAAFFGSWRHSSSDIAAGPGSNREGGSFKPSGTGGSHGNGQGGEMSSSHKRLSKEIFPEPAAASQDTERPDED